MLICCLFLPSPSSLCAEASSAILPPTPILSLNKDGRSQLRFVPEQLQTKGLNSAAPRGK